jgi:hypothetical protein
MHFQIEVNTVPEKSAKNVIIIWLQEKSDSNFAHQYVQSCKFHEAFQSKSNYDDSDSTLNTVTIPITGLKSVEDCLEYAYGVESIIFVFLIHALSEERLSKLSRSPGISYIYVSDFVEPLIKGKAVPDSVPINLVINQSLNTRDRMFDKNTTFYTITMQSTNQPLEKIDNNTRTLIIYQLLIEILLRSPETTQSRKDFFDYARQMCSLNDRYLQQIEQFDSNYTSNQAIHWYTRPSFVHRILSIACSMSNIQELFKVRYFIIDLYNELKQLHSASYQSFDKILRVYHGKCMTIEELEKLDERIGDFIVTTTFLSTTISDEVARFFAGEGNHIDDKVAVIFRIFIDTDVNKTKPFALIGSKGTMSDEIEVLISIGTIFKILMVEKKSVSDC